jgi:hypothetical protein
MIANTVQLMTAGMVHVTNLTPGSERNPHRRRQELGLKLAFMTPSMGPRVGAAGGGAVQVELC